jgi:putative DNA methylase
MWNYAETNGLELWNIIKLYMSNYYKLCEYFNNQTLVNNQTKTEEINLFNHQLYGHNNIMSVPENRENIININLESADSLYHIPDESLEAIITDPPYYGTIQYGELSDFFYCWMRRVLGDIFPDIFWQELTDKDREAVANPSRFRNMGESPDELAKRDYEAKMTMAWNEAYRVLKPFGVLTVQFNHKESGAWDTLAKALIDAGFEITASWAVSTENPQNLHQAKKNSISSTVILVCRKRGVALSPLPTSAWWDDLRPEVANQVEARAEYFEDNDITGIDLYLSAFGVALNVFSKSYPILDSGGDEVRPEVAFAEARKAIARYRFRKLVETDTDGFDPLTQWYLLAWDAFKAREFPFDEARQLALAIGGFSVEKLVKEYKIIDAKSGNCTILTPQQRFKKKVITTDIKNYSANTLIDALHSVILVYEEEKTLEKVHQFMQKTGLVANSLFMKTIEVAFKVLPDNVKEKEVLVNLWLGIDDIKYKVSYIQGKLL